MVEYYLQSESYVKCQDDFRSVLPKSQVPDMSAVFHLVAYFCERASLSDQKLFCHPKILNDVSVGNIRHSLVQSP
jgi:hypothetical protein